MALALSHGGPTIYRSPSRSRQVLVGTIRGVVRMERDTGGTGWHVADRTLDDKHIHALLIEPESGTDFRGREPRVDLRQHGRRTHLGAPG